jgi:hypothetical protein
MKCAHDSFEVQTGSSLQIELSTLEANSDIVMKNLSKNALNFTHMEGQILNGTT